MSSEGAYENELIAHWCDVHQLGGAMLGTKISNYINLQMRDKHKDMQKLQWNYQINNKPILRSPDYQIKVKNKQAQLTRK